MEIHLRTMGVACHMEFTQYYLPPNASEHAPPKHQPVKTGIRFTYPGGMESCMFDFSAYYLYLQYFDTVCWVFRPIKTVSHIKNVSHITYTVLVGT